MDKGILSLVPLIKKWWRTGVIKLYTYFRSSASYRVRIALNLKDLSYESIPVNIREAEQSASSYKAVNPQGLVPALEIDGQVLSQSLAILEYVEECYPDPTLLPGTTMERAQIRALASHIVCDIHPLNNLRVLKYLTQTLQITDDAQKVWYHHWVHAGFAALEPQISGPRFCFLNQVSLADVVLIPQVYNALRFGVDLSAYPKIQKVYKHCMTLPAFQNAVPEVQADAI
jgi:maleylacetoacetate isomerase